MLIFANKMKTKDYDMMTERLRAVRRESFKLKMDILRQSSRIIWQKFYREDVNFCKWILGVVLITLSLSLRAQYTIVTASPYQIVPGDTLTVKIIYKGATGHAHFCVGYPNQLGHVTTVPCDTFQYFPKELYGNDTVIVFKFRTYKYMPLGFAIVSPNWQEGVYILFVEPRETGIAELSHDKPKVVYYDWLGNIVQPEPNKVLFTNDRRKVVIVE